MTNEQFSTLVMVSSPSENFHQVRVSSPRFSGFNLTRLIQRAGMLVLIAFLSFGSYYAVSHYFLKSVQVVGVSMSPTLSEGSHYLLNVWSLRHRAPQHNDIVVIRDPGDHGLSVKRVIAVSGESIYFKGGRVFVDGKMLAETYLPARTHTFTYSEAKEQFITCGKDQYFVLGDNRLRSIDSRSYGPVTRQDVLGLVER